MHEYCVLCVLCVVYCVLCTMHEYCVLCVLCTVYCVLCMSTVYCAALQPMWEGVCSWDISHTPQLNPEQSPHPSPLIAFDLECNVM